MTANLPPPTAGRKRLAALAILTAALVTAAALIADRLFPLDLARLATSGTDILDRSGRALAMRPAPGGVWRFTTGVGDVDPALIDRLIATEDRRFWQHPGVDPIALARAAAQDLRAGRIVSGGSTLTMQVVRMLHPRPRTVGAKLTEILRALQLEAHYSKRDILGMWLTLAPYGGNLEGVGAGSQAWFGHPPKLLEPAEAALLVAIPRRPEALRPDRHQAAALALRDRILTHDGGPVPPARLPFPVHARQAVASLPGGPRIATTLDLPLQIELEHLADERLADLPERASVAILVADAASRELRAIVSGGSRPEEARAGALDLTRAIRSPGSAMKPVIYALAFQDGTVAPGTVLDDLPRRFGSYAPENFDRGFAGTVTAAQALRRSLNLPAVALLNRIGPLRFSAVLQAAGVPVVLPRGVDPSLPLALGGAGTTLRRLGAIYAALATDGDLLPLHVLPAPLARRPFLQPWAAAEVADVLTQPFPDRGPAGVAWKTGTSWGSRDTWAAGFDTRSVAIVWVGRPDGTPLPGATGRSLALPLLARVFDLLPAAPRAPAPPLIEPAELTNRPRPDSLHLLFPPPGAVLSAGGPVTVRVMGGRRPLTFLIDGAKLPADPARREASWRPASPGFYTLTILDADGAAARADVRIR